MSKDYRRTHREMWAYLKRFPDVTAEEIARLRQWVKDGNSPYENGDFVSDEHGGPMDFINTMRFWEGMHQEWLEDPEGFMSRYCAKSSSDEINPEEGMRMNRIE